MKKLLLSLGLILVIVVSANAQPGRRVRRHVARKPYHHAPAPRPRPNNDVTARYYDPIGEVRLHIGGELGITDLGGLFMHEYPYHFSGGLMAEVQTGRWLSLGLGADYYATRNINRHDIQNMDRPYFTSLPVYGNVRLTTPGHGIQLFVEARAGYAIPLNAVTLSNPFRTYETRGLFTGGGIGLKGFGNCLSIGINAIDINNYKGFSLQSNGYGNHNIITDFYIRYSYAIPLN